MAVGHGQLGLRDDLRIFDQLTQESSCRTDAFVEIEGGAIISGETWTPLATAGFELAWDQEFDGEKLDVVSLRTITHVLDRVETEAQVEASDLTWQYDMTEGMLRVHLPSDADPSGNSILVTTCFNFGTAAAEREHLVQPYLGTQQLVDGDFDDATLSDWTTYTDAGFSVTRASTTLVGGGYSALLESDGTGAGEATLSQAPTSANGKARRLFTYYWTPASQPATAHAYVRVGTSTQLTRDGYSTQALGDGLELTPTHGRTRAFVFDFVNHEANVEVQFKLENSAATSCALQLDRATLRPICGWRFFHPRIAADGIPESEQGSLDVYAGSASTGSGAIKLLNDSTAPFERMFCGNPWTLLSRDVRIRYGGAFPDNGQEILWDDMFLGQSGIMAGDQFQAVSDEAAVFSFEETRNILEAEIPNSTYGDAYPTTCEERDLSRPRARVFGAQTHIRPTRVDVDGTTGLGIYEINDPTYAIANALADVTVYAYTDDDAAERNDATKRITLTNSTDYTVSPSTGVFEVNRNPGIFVITSGEGPENNGANDRIDFTRNGTPAVAVLTVGNYTSRTLENMVEAAMITAGSGGTVSYSNTTHKYTIEDSTATTFSFQPNTGPNAHRDALKLLGYTDSDDAIYTGALTYTSDTAVFVGPDEQNFLRCDITGGYCDDAAGTYTGTANIPVELGPDIFRYIHGVFLAEPPSKIDTASFVAARTECPQALGVYFGLLASVSDTPAGPVTLQSAVDKFEISGASTTEGLADISQDGAGVFYWRTRSNIAASVSVFDRDYLTFDGYLNGNDPYGTLRVNYAQDPSTGYVLGVQVTNQDTVLRDRRHQMRTFDSYLLVEADAEDARDALAVLARSPIRHFRFRVRGKLMGAKPGDIVSLTRSRSLSDTTGSALLDADSFRILWIKKNFLTHEVEVVAHTNLVS